MATSFQARSQRVNSAETALHKAIKHFLLIDFNFPNEALDCITNTHIGLELLIKEHYIFNGFPIDAVSIKPIKSLINDFINWDASQKWTANWLRHKRNELTHSGVAKWGEMYQTKINIRRALILTGSLYLDMGYQFEQEFTKLEVAILSGSPLEWREHSKFLGNNAYDFIETDAETALQIANKAFEISFRGYANSWNIENSDTAPLLELYHTLNELEIEINADLDYIDTKQFNPTPFYFLRTENMDEESLPPKVFFLDNIRSSDIDNIRIPHQHGSEYLFKKYIEYITEASISYAKRAVDLPYTLCFLEYFPVIMNELHKQFSNLALLKLDSEDGIMLWNYDEFVIRIKFDENSADIGWTEDHKERLLSIIEHTCGMLPDSVKIEIKFNDTIFSKPENWKSNIHRS